MASELLSRSFFRSTAAARLHHQLPCRFLRLTGPRLSRHTDLNFSALRVPFSVSATSASTANVMPVGLVSEYDLLALDSISGTGKTDTGMFPEVDSTWKTFNEVQNLLSKTNGQVVGDVMTPAPIVIRPSTNLELQSSFVHLPISRMLHDCCLRQNIAAFLL